MLLVFVISSGSEVGLEVMIMKMQKGRLGKGQDLGLGPGLSYVFFLFICFAFFVVAARGRGIDRA